MINISVGKESPRPMGLLAYISRFIIERAHTRIQTPNFAALQMLLTATKGDTDQEERRLEVH